MGRTLFWMLVAASLAGPARPLAADGAGAGPSAVSAGAPQLAAVRLDCIEVRLTPAATRLAAPVRRSLELGARFEGATERRMRSARLGVPALDALAARYRGLSFEAEFCGESPPADERDPNDFTAFYRVRLPEGLDPREAVERFRALPEVASAELIPLLPLAGATPNDSLWSISTWFDDPIGDHDVDAPEAWALTTGDTSVVIAIIDTGILPYHPDLGGMTPGLAGNVWRNWAEVGGVAGVDDDGNGYVDDDWGWDFVALAGGGAVTPGEDWQDADNDPNDFTGHGTKVASIAGALTDNGIGAAGMVWNARLMALRIGWAEPSATYGVVDMSYAAEAIRYATRNGASVINCSFQTQNLSGLAAAAQAATRAGITIVCAAGNGGTPNHALGDREAVIAVAATEPTDEVWNSSNTGPYVDLAAPGVGVASAWVTNITGDSISLRQPGYERTIGGTSFAAPMVAGAAALVQSDRLAHGMSPLSPFDLLFRLRETTDDIAAANPFEIEYGSGRLNVYRALTEASTSWTRRAGSNTIGPPVEWSATSGAHVVAFAAFNNRLLMLNSTGDTLANLVLPGRPGRQPAMADMGGGFGPAIFIGTLNGRVTGHRPSGAVLPGWPVSDPGTFALLFSGPALADLDGDGVREIVCGSDVSLWAWDTAGVLLPAFPISPGTIAFSGPVALADLDGAPGAEIVVLTQEGDLHAYRADGSEPVGWPIAGAGGSAPPVVARLGSDTTAIVLAPRGTQLLAHRPNGTTRFTYDLGANIGVEPALGDLDGDGVDEIVVAGSSGSTHRLAVLDTNGTPRASWPLALSAAPAGAPVIGALRPGGGNAILIRLTSMVVAFDDSARAVRGWPRPGLAAQAAAITDFDGDGRTDVLGGSGVDSLLFFYDAGVGTWPPLAAGWSSFRGGHARLGTRIGAPPPVVIDDLAPAAVTLAQDSIGPSAVRVTWTAPGDDGTLGRTSLYQLQMTTDRGQAGLFTIGLRADVPPPDSAGSTQRYLATGLRPGATYYFALRARDDAGNWSVSSAVLVATIPLTTRTPFAETGVAALRPLARPSRVPVEILWQGARGGTSGPQSIRLFDVSGRMVREFALGADSAGVVKWDGRDRVGLRVPAGLYFSRLASGSVHAETRIVLLP